MDFIGCRIFVPICAVVKWNARLSHLSMRYPVPCFVLTVGRVLHDGS